MKPINLEPLTELTLEDVQRLIMHATRSSIRRAAATHPMVKVAGTENVPTLYYIEMKDPKTGKFGWTIHALSVEISKFLLCKSINSSTSEEPTEEPSEEPTVEPTEELTEEVTEAPTEGA